MSICTQINLPFKWTNVKCDRISVIRNPVIWFSNEYMQQKKSTFSVKNIFFFYHRQLFYSYPDIKRIIIKSEKEENVYIIEWSSCIFSNIVFTIPLFFKGPVILHASAADTLMLQCFSPSQILKTANCAKNWSDFQQSLEIFLSGKNS